MSRFHTDALLADPLAVPTGIESIMRNAELRARELYAQAMELMSGGNPLPVLQEATEDLNRFLEDRTNSMLHRMLRRPRNQRRMHSPAGRGFSQYADGLLARAERALETQKRVTSLRADLERITSLYEKRLPHFLAERLRRIRADEPALARLRRPVDVELISKRLAGVDQELNAILRELPSQTEDNNSSAERFSAETATQPTTAELLAIARLRLRQRAALRKETNVEASVRATLEAHLDRLRDLSPNSDESAPVRYLSEQFLGEVKSALGYFEGRHEDLWLWPGVMFDSARRLVSKMESADRPISVSPRVQPEPPNEQKTKGGTLFVVPLDSDLVWISDTDDSAVSVWSRAIDVGRTIEARVVGNEDGLIEPTQSPSDVRLLFDGSALEVPGWYENIHPVRLHVIDRAPYGWFARVERRGRIQHLKSATTTSAPPNARAFRTLASPLAARSSVQPVSLAGDGVVHEYLRYKTRLVNTSIETNRVAWLREPPAQLESGKSAIQAERGIMDALLRVGGRAHALSYLGRGALPNGHEGLLYELPMGLRVADSAPLRAWVYAPEGKLDCLSAVAKTLLLSHTVGWSIGDIRLGAFLFGLRWDLGHPQPRLVAIIANAPFAAKFNEPYTRAGSTETLAAQEYWRLGVKGVFKPLNRGGLAERAIDYRSFGLFALDLLAREQFEQGKRWKSWETLPEAVATGASSFDSQALALRISRCIASPSATEQLFRVIQSLAVGGVGDLGDVRVE